jgi:hypothetical protein
MILALFSFGFCGIGFYPIPLFLDFFGGARLISSGSL